MEFSKEINGDFFIQRLTFKHICMYGPPEKLQLTILHRRFSFSSSQNPCPPHINTLSKPHIKFFLPGSLPWLINHSQWLEIQFQLGSPSLVRIWIQLEIQFQLASPSLVHIWIQSFKSLKLWVYIGSTFPSRQQLCPYNHPLIHKIAWSKDNGGTYSLV